MEQPRLRDWRAWRDGLLWGTVLGAFVLGAGGRLVMRAIAHVTEQGTYFTVRGSLTVVAAGAGFGAAGGALFVISRRLFPTRRWLGWFSFWAACLLITLHVVSPVSLVRLGFFLPLLVTYGVSLHLASRWRAGAYRDGDSSSA